MMRRGIELTSMFAVLGMAYWAMSMLAGNFMRELAQNPTVADKADVMMWIGFGVGALVTMTVYSVVVPGQRKAAKVAPATPQAVQTRKNQNR